MEIHLPHSGSSAAYSTCSVKDFTNEERRQFFNELLPAIIKLALQLPRLFPQVSSSIVVLYSLFSTFCFLLIQLSFVLIIHIQGPTPMDLDLSPKVVVKFLFFKVLALKFQFFYRKSCMLSAPSAHVLCNFNVKMCSQSRC